MLLSLSLPAQVKAGNHVFGECPLVARLLASSSSSSWWCGDRLLPGVSGDRHCFPFFATSSGTTTSTGTTSTSASSSAAGYVSHMCWIKFMIGSIICIFIMLRYDR
jgi:hypothetical protein